MSVPASTDQSPPTPRKRVWRRRIGLFFLSLLVLLFVVYVFVRALDEWRLSEAIAAVSQTDPRWRLADIEADREQVPDEENAALVVQASYAGFPAGWVPPKFDVPEDGVEPNQRLRPDTVTDARAERDRHPAVLAESGKLAELSRGRYPITYSPNGLIFTATPHHDQVRAVFWILNVDANLRTEGGDLAGALRAARAAVVAVRSIGDEPGTGGQLLRVGGVQLGARQFERILGHGEIGAEELQALQALLRTDEQVPLLRDYIRGERASLEEMVIRLHAGTLPPCVINRPPPDLMGWMAFNALSLRQRAEHAYLLGVYTELAGAADLPLHESIPLIRKRSRTAFVDSQTIGRPLLPVIEKMAEAFQRHYGTLRCLNVAIAAERYRLTQGRWPDSVSVLVPTYLSEIPLDPYDGQPLRLKRTEGGLIVYCVGFDQQDDGGIKIRERPTRGTDWGFQMWDVDKRRQPAPPPPPDANPLDPGVMP